MEPVSGYKVTVCSQLFLCTIRYKVGSRTLEQVPSFVAFDLEVLNANEADSDGICRRK